MKHTFDMIMSRLLPFLLFTSVAMICCVVPGGLGVGVYVASDKVSLQPKQYLNISDVHLYHMMNNERKRRIVMDTYLELF